MATRKLVVELSAAIIAVSDESPQVLTVGGAALPAGPFDPSSDRTIELGVRRWVREQAGLELGYVEQLYTFGDRNRDPREQRGGPRILSIGYLALVRQPAHKPEHSATQWRDWYDFLPYEDWRSGRPRLLDRELAPQLRRWVRAGSDTGERRRRRERVEDAFGLTSGAWNDDRVLERYELLYEARIDVGQPLALDHRRILATAVGRLRGKITYRPVIFELMPPHFTLTRLQRTAEALAGTRLHTSNFRRLIDGAGLVEGTGRRAAATGGRPAEEFRFRREVLLERPAPGVRPGRRVPAGRSSPIE